MKCDYYQKLEDVQKLVKHKNQLEECGYHIEVLRSWYVRAEDLCRAEEYARETYNDLWNENPVWSLLAPWTGPKVYETPVQTLSRRLDMLRLVLAGTIADDTERIMKCTKKQLPLASVTRSKQLFF